MLPAGKRVPQAYRVNVDGERWRPLCPFPRGRAGNTLSSKAARVAHSAEPETLLAIPIAEITYSIVPCSTRIGILSLPEVRGSGSTFVEPASCKAKLDNELSPERVGLCTRSRKS